MSIKLPRLTLIQRQEKTFSFQFKYSFSLQPNKSVITVNHTKIPTTHNILLFSEINLCQTKHPKERGLEIRDFL